MKLSVVIPAYNESDRILVTLEKSIQYLARQEYESEMLVVSDGSTDRTAEVVQSFDTGKKVKLSVLEYFPNRGKGYAVRYGMLRGKGEFIIFMDADYAVPIQNIEPGLSLVEGGADVAIGSRTVKGAVIRRQQNLSRRLSARIYTAIQNLYLGIHYGDTQCGFKIFKREAAKRLFGNQRLSSVIFDPEILWLAKIYGMKVAEFPVTWTHVEDSRIQYDSLKKSLFVFKELFRIKGLHPEIR